MSPGESEIENSEDDVIIREPGRPRRSRKSPCLVRQIAVRVHVDDVGCPIGVKPDIHAAVVPELERVESPAGRCGDRVLQVWRQIAEDGLGARELHRAFDPLAFERDDARPISRQRGEIDFEKRQHLGQGARATEQRDVDLTALDVPFDQGRLSVLGDDVRDAVRARAPGRDDRFAVDSN